MTSEVICLGAALLGAPVSVAACPVCFSVEEGPVTDGVRTAVLVLIGVTVMVLAGFGVFITRFIRRSRLEGALATSAGSPTPGSERLETVEKKPDPLCR